MATKKSMFPREFVEYTNTRISVGSLKYNANYGIYAQNFLNDMTLDDLYYYWLENVKDKKK